MLFNVLCKILIDKKLEKVHKKANSLKSSAYRHQKYGLLKLAKYKLKY